MTQPVVRTSPSPTPQGTGGPDPAGPSTAATIDNVVVEIRLTLFQKNHGTRRKVQNMAQHGTPIEKVSIRTAEFGIRGHRNKIAAYALQKQTPMVAASIEHSKSQIAKYEAAKAARIAEGAK